MASPFEKILIANRGEIAVRILRACRELGLQSVAVFSEADRGALHARLADEAVFIGPAPAGESYLDAGRILEAARRTGAGAVHPGYGFLAENAEFAQAVAEAGLTFIGPPPEAIRSMGDKAEARARMEAAGVPVVPGYHGPDRSPELKAAAAELGFPVMVKAAAGGGGKGMRIVRTPAPFEEAVAAARREAQHAFGDPRLILEKYVAEARHIEIQVLADGHGRRRHLFERECSIQRRHQKILEETPSPFLDPDMRVAMGAAALAAAEAVGYVNAGTVEFIVDPRTKAFYFLEMNTRLQVEHPVTELVTGLDLVAWQMRIAAGEPLTFAQADLFQRGHAIECRLYAEDPANGFLPESGPLLRFVPPEGPGVRVDSGVVSGDFVGTHYDPLLAKLVVHAESRAAAIQRMQIALAQTVVLGLKTNLDFLRAVLVQPAFQAGETTTAFIERHLPLGPPEPAAAPVEALIAAALIDGRASGPAATPNTGGLEDPYSPWARGDGFRLGAAG